MIIEYYRNDNYRSHYILTEKSVIYMERCATFFDNFEIPYNEIMSIMYVCTNETYEKYVFEHKRGLVKEKDIRHFHYIIIQSHNQRIVIDTSSIKGKDLWKIINACLYFNPNIIVDGFVKSILIHKKIPLFFNLKTDNQREYENLTRYK